MLTNMFNEEVDLYEIVDLLVEGTQSGGECIQFSDGRGIHVSIRVDPKDPKTIVLIDDFRTQTYPLSDVEEAVEDFEEFVEEYEKAEFTYEEEYA